MATSPWKLNQLYSPSLGHVVMIDAPGWDGLVFTAFSHVDVAVSFVFYR